MADVKIEHSFSFLGLDTSGNYKIFIESLPRTFSGNGELIPKSTWQLSCEASTHSFRVPSTPFYRNVWHFMINLQNYEDFKMTNILAVGTANLTGNKESTSEIFDLTPLNELKGMKIWSFQSDDIVKGKHYTIVMKISLMVNKSDISKLQIQNLSKMQNDFSDLLKNGCYSDLVLVAGDKEFHVHKSILSGRSEVFHKMLEIDMKEKNENKVVIEDVKSEVLKKMLMYVYSGSLGEIKNEDHDFLEELFNVSEKYALPDLRKVVLLEMGAGITVENLGRRFLLADQFEEMSLRQKCLEFIRDNCGELSTYGKSILF